MDVMVWLLLVKQEYADRTGLSITSQVSVDRRRRANRLTGRAARVE
jgi:hypothetical protein